MNDILIIIVDDSTNHGMRAKKCSGTCTKVRRNRGGIERYIINLYPIFVTLRKTHGYENLTGLFSGILP